MNAPMETIIDIRTRHDIDWTRKPRTLMHKLLFILRNKLPFIVASRTYNVLRKVEVYVARTQHRYEEAYEVKCVWDKIRNACFKTNGLELIKSWYYDQVDEVQYAILVSGDPLVEVLEVEDCDLSEMCIDEFHHAILKFLEDRDLEMEEVLEAHDCIRNVGAAAEALVANIHGTKISSANACIKQERLLSMLNEMLQDLVEMRLKLPELGQDQMKDFETYSETVVPALVTGIERIEEELEWTFTAEDGIGDYMEGFFRKAKNILLHKVCVVEKRVQEKEELLNKYEELFLDPDYEALVDDYDGLCTNQTTNVSMVKTSQRIKGLGRRRRQPAAEGTALPSEADYMAAFGIIFEEQHKIFSF